MKKLIKIVLWTIAIILVLTIVAVLAIPLWLGPTVRGVANSAVPSLTGCEFKLDQCDINPYSGKIFLGGLSLKNPKGFDEPEAVSFESLKIDLSFASLLTDKIHVNDITLEKPFVSYVFDGEGTNNFERIAAYVEAHSGSEKMEKEDKDDDKKDGPKVLIDRLCINGTKVKYRKVLIPIPVPTFTKIGYGKDDDKKKVDDKNKEKTESAEEAKGASFEEAGELIWDSIKDKFSVSGAVGAVGDAAAGAVGAVGEAATGAVKGVSDAATGAVKGVGDAAAGAVKGAANLVGVGEGTAVGNAASKATEATKNAAAAAADSATKAVGATTDAVKDGAKAVGEGLKKLNPFGK